MRKYLLIAVLPVAACAKDKPAPTPAPSASGAVSAPVPTVSAAPVHEKVEIPEVRIRADATTVVKVAWTAPKGTKVNEDAPFKVRWNRSDGLADAPKDAKSTGSAVMDGFEIEVRPMPGAPNATLGGGIDIVVCDAETHSVCVPVHKSLELGFVVVKDAAPAAKIEIPLPEAKVR